MVPIINYGTPSCWWNIKWRTCKRTINLGKCRGKHNMLVVLALASDHSKIFFELCKKEYDNVQFSTFISLLWIIFWKQIRKISSLQNFYCCYLICPMLHVPLPTCQGGRMLLIVYNVAMQGWAKEWGNSNWIFFFIN